MASIAPAATVLSGDVSGTWTVSGSPYILSADCTVASNQVLTIEPGVEVIIGPGVQLAGLGAITAVGTPQEPTARIPPVTQDSTRGLTQKRGIARRENSDAIEKNHASTQGTAIPKTPHPLVTEGVSALP